MNLKKIKDSEETIKLYHGLNYDALEYVISEGALTPRVCAEGGPKAVYFCEYPLNYPCVVSIVIPKSEISWGSTRFEVFANRQYITLKPVGIDEYDFTLEKWGPWRFDDAETVEYLKWMWSDNSEEAVKRWKHVYSKFDEYPNTLQFIINNILEK